jgi:Zn-dependent peptidase ImmA (M78 family)/DNA-binding XRE family transcriptional regulator
MEANILDTIDARELGRELKYAREQRGLKQAEAAEIINVARTTLTAIEKGERKIKVDELIELARAYGRQVSDFVRPRPTAAPLQIQYRGPAQPTEADKQKIAQAQYELEELCRNYLELEEITGMPLIPNYPPEYKITNLKAEQVAEDIAMQERNRLGLGDGPIPILRNILEEDVGLRIFYLPLSPSKFSELYSYGQNLGGCLVVNILHPEERRRWSLAHGYAHFLVHRYQPSAYIEGSYKREQFADYFAMYFLMPTSSLVRRYNKMYQSKGGMTAAGLCILANYYGVSVAALTRRLEGMQLAPRGTWDRLKNNGFKVREAQRQLGLPAIPAQEQELPMRYQYLAVEAYKEGLISEGKFAKFLQVDRLEARGVTQVLLEHAADVTDETAVEIDLEQSIVD